MADERRHTNVGREISWAAIATGTTLAFTVVVPIASAYDFIRTELANIRLGVSSNTQHRAEHERSAKEWIERIKDNERSVRALQVAVSRLETMPKARSDPFTGAEGRKLEKRDSELEARIKDLEDLEEGN